MQHKAKIGINGVGMVGLQVARWFRENNHTLYLYDKYKKLGSPQEINQADIIFICVPSDPSPEGYDLSAIYETLGRIVPHKTVVLKSTVLPGTTDKLQQEFPELDIFFNPEFLTEAKAWEDFINPDRQIIGVPNKLSNSRDTQAQKALAEELLNMLPNPVNIRYRAVLPARATEMGKIAANAKLTQRVIFAIAMNALCEKLGIDYEIVRQIMSADPRIGTSHLAAIHNGKQGAGKTCFPKDLHALNVLAEQLGCYNELFGTIENINMQFLNVHYPEQYQKVKNAQKFSRSLRRIWLKIKKKF